MCFFYFCSLHPCKTNGKAVLMGGCLLIFICNTMSFYDTQAQVFVELKKFPFTAILFPLFWLCVIYRFELQTHYIDLFF